VNTRVRGGGLLGDSGGMSKEPAPDVPRLTAQEVAERLARGEPLAIVDARSAEAWSKADVQAKDAIRVPPDQAADRIPGVPRDRAVVAYCT
jgi:rhodanese-related sulfurtransferase